MKKRPTPATPRTRYRGGWLGLSASILSLGILAFFGYLVYRAIGWGLAVVKVGLGLTALLFGGLLLVGAAPNLFRESSIKPRGQEPKRDK